MLVMSVMEQRNVIRQCVGRVICIGELYLQCCVALYNSDDIQYNVIFTIYTVLYYYIIILLHASFNASQM